MKDTDTYLKTAAGADELKSRARSLPMRVRSVLIMVDGQRSVAELRRSGAALGAPEDCLESLLRDGLIEAVQPLTASPPPMAPLPKVVAEPAQLPEAATPAPSLTDAERFVQAQKFMVETLAEALGLRSFFFTLKLEKCYTLDDLRALVPDFMQALIKPKGELKARTLTQHLQSLLL